MKAAQITEFGKIQDVLKIVEVQKPRINSPDEVLIQMKATSINPIDWKIVEGHLKTMFTPKFPFIPTTDLSGIVVELGTNVKRFKVGDEVYGKANLVTSGSMAQFVVVSETKLVHKPKSISFQEASSIPLAGMTSYQSLKKGGIKAGQNVLILGGSGGTGCFAIQMAKKWGAHVTTTSSKRNFGLVGTLGADAVVDYTHHNWINVLKEHSFDLIYDTVGGQYELTSKLAKQDGQYVTIIGRNAPEGVSGPAYSFILLQDSLEDLEVVNSWIAEGAVKTVVDKVFPLSQAAEALEENKKGRTKGKLVVSLE